MHSICLFAGKEFEVSSLLVVLHYQSISHCSLRKKFIFS
jgi:hypothetical protein